MGICVLIILCMTCTEGKCCACKDGPQFWSASGIDNKVLCHFPSTGYRVAKADVIFRSRGGGEAGTTEGETPAWNSPAEARTRAAGRSLTIWPQGCTQELFAGLLASGTGLGSAGMGCWGVHAMLPPPSPAPCPSTAPLASWSQTERSPC